MATSSRYNELIARISQLETHLLPPVNPTGSYTDKDQDLIRAYCLLCHAEVESYFEEVIKIAVERAVNGWNANKNIVTPVVFHLAFTLKTSSEKWKEMPPYTMVNQSFANLKKAIDSNNGIKENNIQGLLKPIGLSIDGVLQTALNDLGKKRGQIAHSSFKAHTLLDPATEKKNLTQILKEIQIFDVDLDTYCNSGTSSRVPFNMQLGKLSFWDRVKILFLGRL